MYAEQFWRFTWSQNLGCKESLPCNDHTMIMAKNYGPNHAMITAWWTDESVIQTSVLYQTTLLFSWNQLCTITSHWWTFSVTKSWKYLKLYNLSEITELIFWNWSDYCNFSPQPEWNFITASFPDTQKVWHLPNLCRFIQIIWTKRWDQQRVCC